MRKRFPLQDYIWFYRDNETALLYIYNFFASNSLKKSFRPWNIISCPYQFFCCSLIHNKVYELENQIVSVVY
jgi:hypothetical protein